MAITTNGKVSITNLQVGSSADLASIISDESGTGVLAFTNSPTFTTPALGTPSAVTLTNGTGLPVSGITASTSSPIGVGTIELGHATDTTISRASAGVIAVEGNAVLVSGGALGTPSSATLTNATGLPISGLTASTSTAIGVGSIELGHATDTTIARSSAGVVTIEGAEVVTTTGAQTLSNKTLTSPVISSITNTGTLTLPTSTGTVALTSDITITGSSKLSAFASTSSSELAGVISDETGTGALVFGTSPTIGTPAITGGTIVESVIRGLEEDVNVVASAATGTINFDVSTASIWYYTSNATANHTLNFRYSSGATLSSVLAVGDAITVVWMNTNGTTAYYPNTIQIDGSAVTPKVPAAISAGNASAIDVYSFTIIKTAATPTYTVLETQQKFA